LTPTPKKQKNNPPVKASEERYNLFRVGGWEEKPPFFDFVETKVLLFNCVS
jgi:hypothetical protein